MAKKMFEQEGVSDKGFFVCGDMLNLPFKDNIFSLIYAGGSIEHFSDTGRAVSELRRTRSCVTLLSLFKLNYSKANL